MGMDVKVKKLAALEAAIRQRQLEADRKGVAEKVQTILEVLGVIPSHFLATGYDWVDNREYYFRYGLTMISLKRKCGILQVHCWFRKVYEYDEDNEKLLFYKPGPWENALDHTYAKAVSLIEQQKTERAFHNAKKLAQALGLGAENR
jgi:hypothetical protein